MATKKIPIRTDKIAKAIGVPVKEWEGKCFYIASLCVEKKVVSGKVRYGHYTGPVHKNSIFYKHSRIGFSRHGWVELDNGNIYDPTRWAFEHKAPYIYIGENDHYDIGGSAWRNALRAERTPPPFNPSERIVEFKLPKDIIAILKFICQDSRTENTFSLGQLFWIANEHYSYFGEDAEAIYTEFERLSQDALIPIDYWNAVME